jgi:hypothetical protein
MCTFTSPPFFPCRFHLTCCNFSRKFLSAYVTSSDVCIPTTFTVGSQYYINAVALHSQCRISFMSLFTPRSVQCVVKSSHFLLHNSPLRLLFTTCIHWLLGHLMPLIDIYFKYSDRSVIATHCEVFRLSSVTRAPTYAIHLVNMSQATYADVTQCWSILRNVEQRHTWHLSRALETIYLLQPLGICRS